MLIVCIHHWRWYGNYIVWHSSTCIHHIVWLCHSRLMRGLMASRWAPVAVQDVRESLCSWCRQPYEWKTKQRSMRFARGSVSWPHRRHPVGTCRPYFVQWDRGVWRHSAPNHQMRHLHWRSSPTPSSPSDTPQLGDSFVVDSLFRWVSLGLILQQHQWRPKVHLYDVWTENNSADYLNTVIPPYDESLPIWSIRPLSRASWPV